LWWVTETGLVRSTVELAAGEFPKIAAWLKPWAMVSGGVMRVLSEAKSDSRGARLDTIEFDLDGETLRAGPTLRSATGRSATESVDLRTFAAAAREHLRANPSD